MNGASFVNKLFIPKYRSRLYYVCCKSSRTNCRFLRIYKRHVRAPLIFHCRSCTRSLKSLCRRYTALYLFHHFLILHFQAIYREEPHAAIGSANRLTVLSVSDEALPFLPDQIKDSCSGQPVRQRLLLYYPSPPS